MDSAVSAVAPVQICIAEDKRGSGMNSCYVLAECAGASGSLHQPLQQQGQLQSWILPLPGRVLGQRLWQVRQLHLRQRQCWQCCEGHMTALQKHAGIPVVCHML